MKRCEIAGCEEEAMRMAYVEAGRTYVRACDVHAQEYTTHYRIAQEP